MKASWERISASTASHTIRLILMLEDLDTSKTIMAERDTITIPTYPCILLQSNICLQNPINPLFVYTIDGAMGVISCFMYLFILLSVAEAKVKTKSFQVRCSPLLLISFLTIKTRQCVSAEIRLF